MCRYVIIMLELLYHMLKECHTLRGKKLTHLTANDGHTLLDLASTLMGGFPLLTQRGSHTQFLEFSEKVCAVLCEVVGVLEQARWPSFSPTPTPTPTSTISTTTSLTESLMHKMVRIALTFMVTFNLYGDLCDHVPDVQ